MFKPLILRGFGAGSETPLLCKIYLLCSIVCILYTLPNTKRIALAILFVPGELWLMMSEYSENGAKAMYS